MCYHPKFECPVSSWPIFGPCLNIKLYQCMAGAGAGAVLAGLPVTKLNSPLHGQSHSSVPPCCLISMRYY